MNSMVFLRLLDSFTCIFFFAEVKSLCNLQNSVKVITKEKLTEYKNSKEKSKINELKKSIEEQGYYFKG